MEGNSNLKISRSVRSCICHSAVPTRSVVQTGFNFCPHAIPMLRVPPKRGGKPASFCRIAASARSRRGTRGGSEGGTAPPGLGDVVSAAARAPSRRRRRRRPLPTSSGSDRAGPGCHRARRPAGQRRCRRNNVGSAARARHSSIARAYLVLRRRRARSYAAAPPVSVVPALLPPRGVRVASRRVAHGQAQVPQPRIACAVLLSVTRARAPAARQRLNVTCPPAPRPWPCIPFLRSGAGVSEEAPRIIDRISCVGMSRARAWVALEIRER
jgi:hypothetical protein